MHLYFISRGMKFWVDKFITSLQGQFLNWKREDGTDAMVEIQIRPIQLWEVVFPKEHKDVVLTTILGPDGKPYHKRHKKWVAAIRKVLGVAPIPEYDSTKAHPAAMHRQNMDCTGIGIKEDEPDNNGNEGL